MTTMLRLNLYMELPEGFQGSIAEALTLYLKARQAEIRLPNPRDVSVRVAPESFRLNMRYGAMMAVEEGIWRLKDRKWENLLKPPACAVVQDDRWVK